jgi:hypothetical protein
MACVGTGIKYAGLKLNFKPVPPHLKLTYRLAYLGIFRNLKERLGFDRVWVAYSGAAPISPNVLKLLNAIGLLLIEGMGGQKVQASRPSVGKTTFMYASGKLSICRHWYRFNAILLLMVFDNRLKEKGNNGKVIACAIMRKLVHIIFGILKFGKKLDPNYKPFLLDKNSIYLSAIAGWSSS